MMKNDKWNDLEQSEQLEVAGGIGFFAGLGLSFLAGAIIGGVSKAVGNLMGE